MLQREDGDMQGTHRPVLRAGAGGPPAASPVGVASALTKIVRRFFVLTLSTNVSDTFSSQRTLGSDTVCLGAGTSHPNAIATFVGGAGRCPRADLARRAARGPHQGNLCCAAFHTQGLRNFHTPPLGVVGRARRATECAATAGPRTCGGGTPPRAAGAGEVDNSVLSG